MLIIEFSKNGFRLYYCRENILSDILEIDGLTYKIDFDSKENEGFIGFFDWLRVDESKIIGIRICFFEHHKYNSILNSYPYADSKNNGKWTEIIFQGSKYREEISNDQDFTNNFVYKSEEGNFLFTFNLDHLTSEELSSLIPLCITLNNKELIQLNNKELIQKYTTHADA